MLTIFCAFPYCKFLKFTLLKQARNFSHISWCQSSKSFWLFAGASSKYFLNAARKPHSFFSNFSSISSRVIFFLISSVRGVKSLRARLRDSFIPDSSMDFLAPSSQKCLVSSACDGIFLSSHSVTLTLLYHKYFYFAT